MAELSDVLLGVFILCSSFALCALGVTAIKHMSESNKKDHKEEG